MVNRGNVRYLRRYTVMAVLALACVGAWWQLSNWYHSYLSEAHSSKVRVELERYAYDLSAIIQSRENLLNALASYVETDVANTPNPSFYSAKRAETFLIGLFSSTVGVRNFAIAPEGRINMVFPLVGNEEALGHDLLNDPHLGVKDVTYRAIKSRAIAYSTPYELRQGGLGVVLRKAVYSPDGFWGIVSMVMDVIPIIEDAGLTASSGNFNIAIRDNEGRIFFGSTLIFEQSPLVKQVNMADGYWEIAATSITNNSITNKVLTFQVILAGFLILVCSLGFIFFPKTNKQITTIDSPKVFFEQLTHIPSETKQEHSGSPSRLIPFLTSLAIITLVLGFYRFVEQSNTITQQYDFTKALIKTSEDIERKLETDREYLQLIAEELSQQNLDPTSFQKRLTSYVNDHPGLINVTWSDSDFVIRHTAPMEGNSQVIGLKLLLPEPKRASRLAYNSRQPVYTRPFIVIQGKPAFELYVPIFNQNQFLGTLGGVYSINKLMGSILKRDPTLSHYKIEVSDAIDNVFYQNTYNQNSIRLSKAIPLKPVGGNLWLRVSSFQQGPSNDMRMLMLFAFTLAFGLVGTIWIQYRESCKHWRISKELHQSQKHFSAVATASPVAIVIMSQTTGHILYANHQANKLFSFSGESIIGWNSDDLYMNPEDRQLLFCSVKEHDQLEGLEQHMKKANGELLWTSISCRLVAHAEEAVLVACIIDLSERKKYEDQLYTQAHHDNLTGLPNRKLAFDKLDLALAKAVIEKNHVALLYIDVDRFKNINDSLGHVAGDQLLIELASRLLRCVRSNDTVARLAGDEFAIILPEQESSEGAKIVAEKIIEACLPLVSVGERKVPISVSIGITLFPDDAIDIEQLIRSADTAMYQSKAAGRNQFCFFTPQMHEQEDESRMLEK